jgi:hypothetical protein
VKERGNSTILVVDHGFPKSTIKAFNAGAPQAFEPIFLKFRHFLHLNSQHVKNKT